MKTKNEYLSLSAIILEQCQKTIRESKLIQEVPKSEKVPPTKNEQLVIDSWKGLKNKTKVFETIPLIYALYKQDDLTAKDMIDVLKINYDWDSEGKSWLLSLLNKIQDDEKAYETFIKTVVAGTIDLGAPSLKELNGGKTIDDFIHGSITKFYSALKKYSPHNKESKSFTADVVILWGPGRASGVTNGDLLKTIEPNEESLSLLSDKKTLMACVSLKALEGRVGKVTTLFQDRFGGKTTKTESVKTRVEEGVFDLLRQAGSKVSQTFKGLATKFIDWATDTFNAIKDIFSPTSPEVMDAKKENDAQVSEADKVLAAFDEELKEHYSSRGMPITEVSDDESIQISSCFRKQLLSWYGKFENDTKKINQAFVEFQTKTSQYATKNLFRLNFKSLDEKNRDFQNELKRVKLMVDRVKRAKEQPAATKRASCLLLMDSNKPLMFTRKELKNILMSNSNYVSISLLNNMIEELIAKTKSLKTSEALGNLIKFSTELNAEAIFGAATEIPLVKYNGSQLIKFGSRKNYEESHKAKMMDYFKSVETLPIIGLKIYPPKSKETVTYYVMILYTLADYKGADSVKPMDKDFIYNVIAFKCNSGSDFAFAIESDATMSGDKIIKSLASDEAVTL